MKNTARNKQVVFFAESKKKSKIEIVLEKAKKGHRGEFLDIFTASNKREFNQLSFSENFEIYIISIL